MKKWCGLSSSSSTSSNPKNPGNYNYPPPALPSPPLPLPAPPQAVKTHQSHVYQQPLLQIPGCTVHLMDGGDAVEIARGDLAITRFTDENLRLGLATTVKVIGRSSTVQWPLTKDEPVVKLDDHHYLFTIPMREGDPLSYGVSFSGNQIVRERLGGFDKFLRENTCFTDMRKKSSSGEDGEVDWKEFAPKIENYNGVLAQAIANGTGQIIRGIFTCSNAYTNLVQKGGESLLSRAKEENYSSNMKNSATGRLQKTPSNGVGGVAAGKNGNTALNYNLKRARDLSNMTASISKGMLDAIGVASGSTMGPLVRSKTGQAFFAMMPGEVILASLDAVDKILSAAEAAQKQALKETSGATVRVVSEKYGDSAGVAAGDALAVAGNVAGTAWNVVKMRRAINPAAFATSGMRNNKNQYIRY